MNIFNEPSYEQFQELINIPKTNSRQGDSRPNKFPWSKKRF